MWGTGGFSLAPHGPSVPLVPGFGGSSSAAHHEQVRAPAVPPPPAVPPACASPSLSASARPAKSRRHGLPLQEDLLASRSFWAALGYRTLPLRFLPPSLRYGHSPCSG